MDAGEASFGGGSSRYEYLAREVLREGDAKVRAHLISEFAFARIGEFIFLADIALLYSHFESGESYVDDRTRTYIMPDEESSDGARTTMLMYKDPDSLSIVCTESELELFPSVKDSVFGGGLARLVGKAKLVMQGESGTLREYDFERSDEKSDVGHVVVPRAEVPAGMYTITLKKIEDG